MHKIYLWKNFLEKVIFFQSTIIQKKNTIGHLDFKTVFVKRLLAATFEYSHVQPCW